MGFEEFVGESLARKETLEVEEDCLVLELSRSKFYESYSESTELFYNKIYGLVFEGKCLTIFKEYYKKKLLSWEEDAQKNLKDEDETMNKKV